MTQKKAGESLRSNNEDTTRKGTQEPVRKKGVATYFRVATDCESQKLSSEPDKKQG